MAIISWLEYDVQDETIVEPEFAMFSVVNLFVHMHLLKI